MPFSRRSVLAAGVGVLGAPALVRAQTTGARQTRIVVPFPPGNASDVAARLISTRLSEKLGQSFYVENKPGASGVIGIKEVIAAAPDGHTLLLTSLSPLVILPHLRKDTPYDPLKDLDPVALVGWTGMALVATPDFPASTLKDAVEHIRANPGKYNYGHVGPGSLSHVSMVLLMRAAKLDVTAVSYRGSGEAMTEMMAGRLHLMFDGMTSSLPQVAGGKVKGLAVNSPTRSTLAPDLPSLREVGIPVEHDVTGWTGLLAPRGTPAAIIDRLNAEVNAIIQEKEFQEKSRILFLEAWKPESPAAFSAYMARELAKWGQALEAAGVKSQ